MTGVHLIDVGAFAILLIATLRGLSLGLIRELFSLGALAAAVIAVRVWNEPFAHWLQRASGGQLPHSILPWVAGTLLAMFVVVAVGTFGHVMRQGARAAGLGLFDRLGGAALGFAEGVLVAGVLLFVVGSLLGRNHTLLVTSHSFALLERTGRIAELRVLREPDVAAAPKGR